MRFKRSVFTHRGRLTVLALLGFVVSTLGSAFTPIVTHALNNTLDKTFYSYNDILFYDPNACVAGGKSSDDGLVGNDNLEKSLRYFVDKGLSLAEAAGIIGNFSEESGMNPAIIQGLNGNAPTLADKDYVLVGDIGFGIAQWSTRSRQLKLMSLGDSTDRDYIDLGLQLDFTWKELSTDYASTLTKLKATTEADKAALIFHNGFEGSNDTASMIQERLDAATQVFEQYKLVIKDNTTDTANSSSAVCTGDGTASEFVDGFAIYNQSDPNSNWAAIPYGTGQTIGSGGCGPSAMAMIITALTKSTVTPKDTGVYGRDNNPTTVYYPVAGGNAAGSSWNLHTVIGGHWGLNSKELGKNVAAINKGLRDGGLVIMSGTGSAPFTTAGHFIVIRAVTGDNKWLIGDSNGTAGIENSKKEWDPVYILSMVGSAKNPGGYVWLMTK